MYCDYHLHSAFSSDSETPVVDLIERAIELGIPQICLTDHQDFDMPKRYDPFTFDTDPYFQTLRQLQEQYRDKIRLMIGVELGIQPHLREKLTTYINHYPFDYVIGSTHLVKRIDPYHADYFEGRSEKEAHLEYFEETIQVLNTFSDIDSLGHLDYVVRYGPTKNRNYQWRDFADQIDTILRFIIDKGIALECNTAGYKAGLGHPNPTEEILIRYRELGGELLTLGSDGHRPEHVAYHFDQIGDVLKSCGFKYYTIFEARKPIQLPL